MNIVLEVKFIWNSLFWVICCFDLVKFVGGGKIKWLGGIFL